MLDRTLFGVRPLPGQDGIVPRDYQVLAHDCCLEHFDNGSPGVLLRMATGSGKTLTASLIANSWLCRSPNHRVMVISYETQLVEQFAREISEFLGTQPGIEMSSQTVDPKHVPAVVVASRQSLVNHQPPLPSQIDLLEAMGLKGETITTRRAAQQYIDMIRCGADRYDVIALCRERAVAPEWQNNTWSRVHKFDWSLPWLLIYDEAHRHCYSLSSVRNLVDWFSRNPEHRRIGLTATPKRADGKSLGDVMFPAVAIDYPLYMPGGKPCAVVDGYAVPYVQRYIEVQGVDFANVGRVSKEKGADFDDAALSAELNQEKRLAAMCEPLLEMVGKRQTLIFSPSVEMAKNVRDYINARSETTCPCGLVRWMPTVLLPDGVPCKGCGHPVTSTHVTRSGRVCESLDGSIPTEDRWPVYENFEKMQFQFLSVCGLCIARGTKVLTDRGEVAIEDVTTDMKLWDGIEFVSHDGVIAKGVQPVMHYAGLTATGDHHVWTDAGWERFAMCKQQGIAIRVSAIDGQAVRESCGYYRDDCSIWKESTCWVGSVLRQVRKDLHQVLLRDETWTGRLQAMCKAIWSSQLVADALPATTPVQEKAEVYDILNAGPRHRFTANGLIVSNCREGYDNASVSCVAVFRPVSEKASSLAEQMKGRACRPYPKELARSLHSLSDADARRKAIADSPKPNALIVDLTGICGLADCASTIEIYTEGLPDEVKKRAREILHDRGKDGVVDVGEVVRQARKEVEATRERIRKEREEAEKRAREAAERRSLAQAEARFTTHDHGHGRQTSSFDASEAQMNFIGFLGLDLSRVLLTKKQAGRIISQLRERVPIEDVIRTNGLRADEWKQRSPTAKQIALMTARDLPLDRARTPFEASLLIDAAINPTGFVSKKQLEIRDCRGGDELSAIGKDIALVRGILPDPEWQRLVVMGRKRRMELTEDGDTLPE